ncbi:DsbC family protein [Ramlibacter albus]|uniref:Thiol:disulfide interchange protein n=1 Tax=Ramlibacter albus TaxID=2079448 RepID=A0A923S0G8_9BURK|nr:DsbC family protein [Ramlibacter albus]MBC5763191.1 DsbC family protein [Ramlibacter albus]
MNIIGRAIVAALFGLGLATAFAQDYANLRKNLESRLPMMGKIDEITKSPVPGLLEVRVGTDIYYADPEGNYVISGNLIDTKSQKNLTEERQEKLLAVDFDALPFKDAFTVVRGNGKRRVAVFQDPNCPYCKRFEKDMLKVDNVTVYMFLYPILGPRSVEMSKQIWCSRDKDKVWENWMTKDQAIPGPGPANCDTTAITRNVDYGKKIRISGTPTIFFIDGTRVPGAIGAAEVEKLLAKAK